MVYSESEIFFNIFEKYIAKIYLKIILKLWLCACESCTNHRSSFPFLKLFFRWSFFFYLFIIFFWKRYSSWLTRFFCTRFFILFIDQILHNIYKYNFMYKMYIFKQVERTKVQAKFSSTRSGWFQYFYFSIFIITQCKYRFLSIYLKTSDQNMPSWSCNRYTVYDT